MVTDASAKVVSRHDYLPFGEEVAGVAGRSAPFGNADEVNQKFTAQERDQETGLDFFNARYMSSLQGRFLSPDPGNAGADITNPQSWNGYSYVLNNPLALVDPTGNCSVKDGDSAATDDPGEPCVVPGDTSVTVNGGPPDTVPIDPCFYCGYIPGNPSSGSREQPPLPIFSFSVTGFSIRSKNETFSECMHRNAADYSAIGVVDTLLFFPRGQDLNLRSTFLGNALLGNVITGTFYGLSNYSDAADNAASTATGVGLPNIVRHTENCASNNRT